MKRLTLLCSFAILFSHSTFAQELLPYRLVSKYSKHPRAIAASCANLENNKCTAFKFYYINDNGKASLITSAAFGIESLENLKAPDAVFVNVFTKTSRSATGAAVKFVHDADGSYGDSKAADIAKGATRGVGYVVGSGVGIAGDAIGYPIGTIHNGFRKAFRNPKLNKLVRTFEEGKTVRIAVGKIDRLTDIIFCAGPESRDDESENYSWNRTRCESEWARYSRDDYRDQHKDQVE